MASQCPLCHSWDVRRIHTSSEKLGSREFFLCSVCDLVHVPARYHLDHDAEKARYLLHNNDPADPEYRKFLGRLWNVMRPELSSGAQGLDFGSGPGPALMHMATEDGFNILPYDPYFASDQSVLESRFDFITCTETAEHFSSPRSEFKQLHSLLKAGGILGVMTSMSADWSQFPNWHYNRDPTHIAYYSRRTLEWVSDSFHMEVDFPTANVAIFRKPTEVR